MREHPPRSTTTRGSCGSGRTPGRCWLLTLSACSGLSKIPGGSRIPIETLSCVKSWISRSSFRPTRGRRRSADLMNNPHAVVHRRSSYDGELGAKRAANRISAPEKEEDVRPVSAGSPGGDPFSIPLQTRVSRTTRHMAAWRVEADPGVHRRPENDMMSASWTTVLIATLRCGIRLSLASVRRPLEGQRALCAYTVP